MLGMGRLPYWHLPYMYFASRKALGRVLADHESSYVAVSAAWTRPNMSGNGRKPFVEGPRRREI